MRGPHSILWVALAVLIVGCNRPQSNEAPAQGGRAAAKDNRVVNLYDWSDYIDPLARSLIWLGPSIRRT